MRLLHLLSIMLSLAFTASASIAAPGRHLSSSAPKSAKLFQEAGVDIKDFLISEVYTSTVPNLANSSNSSNSSYSSSFNTTLHFRFHDPNSNTSTVCTDSWVVTNASNTVPYSYVACDPTEIEEFFQWKFISYSGLDSFQIAFSHLFADPVDYPPPFDVVEYFSAPTNFTLECTNTTELGRCALPGYLSPVHAIIDGISN